jgi:LPS export ABC transporter protein LptC
MIWVFQNDFLKLSIFHTKIVQLDDSSKNLNEVAYLEKIDNFLIKEYSEEQALLHTIKADTYYSYEDAPSKFFEVEVQTFDELQNQGLTMVSNFAEIDKLGEILFSGEVNIKTKNGAKHELDTESLIVLSDAGKIKSNKDVSYLGKNSKINAQGMDMDIDSDTMFLNGIVKINQDSGAIIETKNLSIVHTDGKKQYQSKEETLYRSEDNIVTSQKGVEIDMNQNIMNLLGKVEVLTNSGSTLKSSNLIIDQSNGGEIFKSNSYSHFKSSTVDIEAKKMHYDAVKKKLKLMNKVIAVYE